MVQMDDVKVKDLGSEKIIEVIFKHERKQRNEGFQYYIPRRFFPIFARYLKEIWQDTVAAGNLQVLKNLNKIGRRRVQNTGKNNVNRLHVAGLNRTTKGYSSYCWRRPATTNLTDAGVSLINLKRHRQWVSNKVVEGYIANSLPLREERLNCLLPAEEKEEVGQVNSAKNNQAIERFDSYVDLSNDSNLPVAPFAENGELTLYGFSQFDIPDLRTMDATGTSGTVLQATSTDLPVVNHILFQKCMKKL